jgi:hypothetical protein
VRIKWPAHLTAAPLFFPSPLFPHQQALFQALEPLVSQIAALFLQLTDRPATDVFSYLDLRFAHCLNQGGFYRALLGAAPGQEPFSGGDEELFTCMGDRVRDLLPFGLAQDAGLLRQKREPTLWINGAARSMFAVAAADHYLGVGRGRALELLEARRVRRSPGRYEQVLAAYAHAIRDESVEDAWEITQSVLVVVPGIEVALPCQT